MKKAATLVLTVVSLGAACGPASVATVYTYYGRRGDSPESLAVRMGDARLAKAWAPPDGGAASAFAAGASYAIPSATLKKHKNARAALEAAGRARTARRLGDLTAAAAELEAANLSLPDDPSLTYELGVVYAEAGDYARAEATLARAYELAPQDEDIALALALTYLALGDAGRAAAVFDGELLSRPADPFPYVASGEVYAATRSWPQARHAYFEYLKLCPASAWATFARAGVKRTAREEMEEARVRKAAEKKAGEEKNAAPAREAGDGP